MFNKQEKLNSLRLLLYPLLILSCYSIAGQSTGDPREDFLYGEYYLMRAMYSEALPFYLSALEANPDNSNINYRIGLCYSKMLGEQHNALPYLKKSVLEINKHYVEGKYYSTGAPREAWLLLGDAYLRNDELLNASRAYHEYKNLIGDTKDKMYQEVMRRISVIGISFELQRSGEEIDMTNLGSHINSRFSDYNPVLSGDQKTLVYTQFWESYDRILLSRLTENGWSLPEDISTQIQSDGMCYTSALSFDGKDLYLVCHDEENYDLFVSKNTDGVWSKMEPLPGKVNSKYRESSVAISADGRELYFSSDRPEGEGGFDIYHAVKTGEYWSEVTNLGKPVNTSHNEEAPYITNDGTILYFSSDGHLTVGNMDILYSTMNADGTWQEPLNMGTPVNTTNDDLFFVYFKDYQTGYLSRDIPEGMGRHDIYRIDFDKPSFLASDGITVKQISRPIMEFTMDDNTKIQSSFLTDRSDMAETENSNAVDTAEYIPASTNIESYPGYSNTVSIENQENVFHTENENAKNIEDVNQLNTEKNSDTVKHLPSEEYLKPHPENYNTENVGNHENTSQIEDESVKKTEDAYHLNDEKNINPVQYPTPPVDTSSHSENYDTMSLKNLEDFNIIDKEADENIESMNKLYGTDHLTAYESDSVKTYTIQIYALRKPVSMKNIKLKPVNITHGDDGLYRYTIGEYPTIEDAVKILEEIRASGFPDAFIRNVKLIPNYTSIK